jgi:hypothetical protein
VEDRSRRKKMTKYSNKKYGFTVEASRIEPDKSHEFVNVPEFRKLIAEIPEPYWLVTYDNNKMLISDELFQRFFIREPVLA